MIKLKDIVRDILKEFTGTNVGTGLNIGDSWPDGLFTKYGENYGRNIVERWRRFYKV